MKRRKYIMDKRVIDSSLGIGHTSITRVETPVSSLCLAVLTSVFRLSEPHSRAAGQPGISQPLIIPLNHSKSTSSLNTASSNSNQHSFLILRQMSIM